MRNWKGGLAVAALYAASVLAVPMLAAATAEAAANGLRVLGHVQDASGERLQGVRVQLVHGTEGLTHEAATDENGAFAFPVVASGAYGVKVLPSGGSDLQISLSRESTTVGEVETVTLIATLLPAGPPEVGGGEAGLSTSTLIGLGVGGVAVVGVGVAVAVEASNDSGGGGGGGVASPQQ